MVEIDIITTIGTLGLPIVAYLLLFFKMDKTIERLSIANEKLGDAIETIINQNKK